MTANICTSIRITLFFIISDLLQIWKWDKKFTWKVNKIRMKMRISYSCKLWFIWLERIWLKAHASSCQNFILINIHDYNGISWNPWTFFSQIFAFIFSFKLFLFRSIVSSNSLLRLLLSGGDSVEWQVSHNCQHGSKICCSWCKGSPGELY